MMGRSHKIGLGVLLVATALAVASYKPPATQPASEPAAGAATQPAARDANTSTAALVAQVLADPTNAAARNKLAFIRQSQEAEDLGACQALADGLKLYLRVGAEAARPALERAACSKLAVSLTGSMSTPLDKWLPALREEARSEAAAHARLCQRCGGTGENDCRSTRCHGSGKVPCDKCKGSGTLREERSGAVRFVMVICDECGGSGVVTCPECRGGGVIECSTCQKAPGAMDIPRLAPPREREIRQVIDKVRWLRGGGIDLYTDGAMRRQVR